MDIVKLLRINGESDEANGALIRDVGEEYPVFLESLTNTTYFPVLLESGYQFVGLPYNFKKDGTSIFELPVEDYVASEKELEQMYNGIGAPTSYEDLKKKMVAEEVTTIPMPPTKYTITTREEFIKYLEDIQSISLDDDFLPINYFVAPQARFNLAEYCSDSMSKYTQIMSARREMSLPKFIKLFNWLKQFGLTDNATSQDVLDAYFAWGLDGLNAPIIAKRRQQQPNILNGNNNTMVPSYRATHGFIDSAGNQLTPDNAPGVRWELPSNSPNYLNSVTQSIPVGDTKVQEYRCKVPTTVTILEGPNYNIYYNPDCLVLLLRMFLSLRVKSPVAETNLPLDLALPHNREELLKHCYMEALARELCSKRLLKVDVSSYKALYNCGANPYSALTYVATYDDMDKEVKNADSDTVMVTYRDIEDFINGGLVEEAAREYLQGILDGSINIDNIHLAKQTESSVNTDSAFSEIYALHHVMGVSLEDIHKRISNITEDAQALVFQNGGIKHTMDVTRLKYSMNGYLSDIQGYDLKNAEKCTAFIYVTNVAREVGSETARRHVGIEFFMVVRKPEVNKLIDKLAEKFEERVSYKLSDVNEQAKMRRLKNMFCLSRYFEIAMKGKITWPKGLGGDVEDVPFDMQRSFMATLQRKIENIVTFCSFTIQGTSSRDIGFNMYCTNAYVTPEYVIPRKGYTIHEVPFFALWYNYASTAPEIYAQLIDIGALPRNFQSWSTRYDAEMFKSRTFKEMVSDDTLTYYAKHATEEQRTWPTNLEFDCVTHPIEYMFQGIERPEKDKITLSMPRDGEPSVRIGAFKDITHDDLKDIMYPDTELEEPDQYIRQFAGFSAEAFEYCDDVISKIPFGDNCELVVNEGSQTVYVPKQSRTINFRQLTEVMKDYNIVHVYDRMYMFRSLDGKLWEVRI